MITWKNMDTLAAYGELQAAQKVALASVMAGENGAGRVRAYSAPMGGAMDFNYGARPVDDAVLAALAAFAKEAIENGAEKIVSVGTMALRTAKNSADFVARVKERCGGEVQVIPGEEEARLSYLAVLSGLPLEEGGELVIFDTGGGSTEFIFGQGTTLKNRFSVNLGALIITENFFNDDPVKEGSVDAAVAYID